MSTTHFFLPLRGAGRWRRAAQEIHLTAGGARAKAAGKAAPAQNRRGSSCWSRKSRCCGLGILRDCSLASQPHAPHAPPSPSPTLPSPSPPPPSPSPTLASLSPPASFPSSPPPSPSLPQPSPSRRHLATTIAIDRHRPRRHGLRHPLPGRRRRRLRLRLRLCRHCPARSVRLRRPRRPRHCRGTRRLSHSIAPHRDGVRSVCGTSWFSLRFCLKAPHKRQIFSRGCRPAPRGGPRSAFFTIPAVSGAHFGSTTAASVSK